LKLKPEVEKIFKKKLLKRIESAIENIRPYLQTDGGDVKVLDVTEDMILKIELQGACGSCPMSSMTLKAGIEETIRAQVPDIMEVKAVKSDGLTQTG